MNRTLLGILLPVFSTSGAGLYGTLFDPPPVPKVELPVLPDPPALPDPVVEYESPIFVEPLSKSEQFYSHIQTSVHNKGTPFPLANWLSATQVPSFYQTTFHSLLSQEKYFTSIESLEQYNFDVTPYGFDSNFKWGGENFRLQTLGVTGAGNRTFDSWTLGGGAGYFHSNLRWEKKNQIDSFFFGPQVTYQFGRGYLQGGLTGIYNIYDEARSIGGNRGISGHSGWDVFSRLEGGMNWELPFFNRGTFFVQPSANLSYLGVFNNDYKETGPDGLTVPVKTSYSDFFSSRLAIQFWKELYKKEVGFLIPSLSLGWVSMNPISQGKMTLGNEESEEAMQISAKRYQSSNQMYVAAKVTGIHKNGTLLAVAFEANIAELYPVYTGTVRFKIDW